MELKHLSLIEIQQKIDAGETTAEQVYTYFLDQISSQEDTIQAFNHVNTDVPKMNRETQLWGLPIGIKDIFCEKWIPTTCSSNMLKDFIPPYDATVIQHLNTAGMSSIGKVSMDEYAMGSTNESSALKQPVNPWWTDRIPGGSSGGSAAAVAAGMVPAALGTDTGGSIRQPASMCGVVGFKPTYGRNSRYGVVAMASSLDCPGTLTHTVADAGMLYDIMNGYDQKEATSLPGKDTIDSKIWESQDLTGMKIGVPKEYFAEGLDTGVREQIEIAIEQMKSLWAEIKEISLPMTQYAIATYYIIMPAEVSTNLARYDGIRYGHMSEKAYESIDEMLQNNRSEGFWQEAQQRCILGSYVLSAGYYDAYYKKATQIRTLIIDDFNAAFEEVDAIVSPVSPSVAWKKWEKMDDPVKMYLSDVYTIPASLAGLPWISVPCGFATSTDAEAEELPVGLQILTPQLQEQRLLQIAHVYEQARQFREEVERKRK